MKLDKSQKETNLAKCVQGLQVENHKKEGGSGVSMQTWGILILYLHRETEV